MQQVCERGGLALPRVSSHILEQTGSTWRCGGLCPARLPRGLGARLALRVAQRAELVARLAAGPLPVGAVHRVAAGAVADVLL